MIDLGQQSSDRINQLSQVLYVEELESDWELVLCETLHRMMNTLTLLGASVRREFRGAWANEVSEAVDRFERRIVAFGRLYQLLSPATDNQEIAVAGFLESLCKALSDAILEPTGIRCEVAIERGLLPATQCHRLGLIVTELVTNAAKHAFPENTGGLIRVEAVNRSGDWRCTVADNGVGVMGSVQGVGSRILKSLARSIRARVHGKSDCHGTAVTILVPTIG